MAQICYQAIGTRFKELQTYAIPKAQCSKYFHKPMRIKMSTTVHKTNWALINDEIEAYLKRAIPIQEPVEVTKPMYGLALAGPNSMAPALCVAACELVGGNKAQAMNTATALHVMLAATQAHDQNNVTSPPLKRLVLIHNNFKPSPMSCTFGPNIDILTGDSLFSFGYELLVGFRDHDLTKEDSTRVIRVVAEVARAMGAQGMVSDQLREVKYNQWEDGKVCEEEWARYMYEQKYGGIHACSATCGAILGGGSEEEIEKLRKYGFYVDMIQWLLHEIENEDKQKGVIDVIQGLRELALKELEGFNTTKVELIYPFVSVCKP